MIRKSGFILIVAVPLIVGGWLYFTRNLIVESLAELSIGAMLGTEADMEGVDLNPFEMTARFESLRIVDADDPSLYMIVAGPANFDLLGLQLFAKKIVVEELRVENLSFGVPRPADEVPAPAPASAPASDSGAAAPAPAPDSASAPASDSGAAPSAPAQEGQPVAEEEEGGFNLNIEMPKMNLAALTDEMDVDQIIGKEGLASEKALDQAEADSQARLDELDKRLDGIKPGERLDALQQEVSGLDFKSRDPKKLRASLEALKTVDDKAKTITGDVKALGRDVKAEPGRIKADLAKVDAAFDSDMDAAKRLLKLGGLNLGEVASLLFGNVVMEQFNWVLAKFNEVRDMVSSDENPQTEPSRRVGRNVAFPVRTRAYPTFLVETTAFSGATVAPGGGETLVFSGSLTGLSSNAKVYGKPILLEAVARKKSGEHWTIKGSFDHREEIGVDRFTADGQSVSLGEFSLSGGSLPDKATTGKSTVKLDSTLRGFGLDAKLDVDARDVKFVFGEEVGGATASKRSLNASIREIFGDMDSVQLTSKLTGTLTSPDVSVSSSIDEIFSRRMNALIAQRKAEAEARVRAKLEARVAQRRAQFEQRIAARREKIEGRVAEQEQRVAEFQAGIAAKRNQADQTVQAARQKLDDAKQEAARRAEAKRREVEQKRLALEQKKKAEEDRLRREAEEKKRQEEEKQKAALQKKGSSMLKKLR